MTLRKPFGVKYDERILFGPDNTAGSAGNYLQLAVVNLNSTPKVKVNFTATDGTQCEQVLTDLTLTLDQKTHIFVTYDGALLRGYRNGIEVGNYNLQNCANKVPAGNQFTIGRGASHATLWVYNVYFMDLDEGSPWSAEPYLQLDGSTDRFWHKTSVKNGHTPNVGAELTLRDSSKGDADNTVYICEEDNGDRRGKCTSDAVDSDDFLGQVAINPRLNGEANSYWSSGDGRGYLRYNVQNNFFNGDLDDLRIYEATLSAHAVSQLVNSNGLLYQLDEASGRTQFRNAGTDSTQLLCQTPGNCPVSGIKGYTGQAVRFTGSADQTLRIEKLRQRFGSNFVTSFWWKPEQAATATTPLIRSGQGSEGYTLFATNNGSTTALNARFAYDGVDPMGGSGGSSYDIRCAANEALVGLYGGAGTVVDRVGPLCVAIDGNGNWVGTPTQRGTAGGGGGEPYERVCANGTAVVGFSGRSGSLIDGITLQCARLQPDGYTDVYNRTALTAVGGSGGSAQAERVCPSNLPAAGIRGRAGGLVDAFGLTCRAEFIANTAVTLPNGQWAHIALAQNNDTLLLYVNGEARQTLWFGPAPRADYRLTGNYPVDLYLGGQLQGLLDEVQIQGLNNETALADTVRKPYLESALVYLPLDEVAGSTTFANSTGKSNLICANAAACPQSGIKGQVRESLQFASQGNPPSLQLGDQRHQAFSFATWVKVPSVPQGTASLVSLHNGAAETPTWRLQLDNVDGKIIPVMSALTSPDGNSCGSAFTVAPSNVTLALNQWYHLGVSYDPTNGKNDLSLYLNGQLVHQQRLASLLCRVGDTLRFGQNFQGQMDEFSFYAKPLALTEFLSQYVYQSTWFDVVTNEKFSVDYNAPTVKLTTNRYLKAGTNIFGVAVSDAESGIKTVAYKDNDGLWKSAYAETTNAGIWTFALNVQGNQTVEVRATDSVGNVRSDAQAVVVDSTPPSVALTTSGKQNALVLTGTANDSGSGLQSATIMLFDPLGNPLNAPRDLAVKDGSWRYTQTLPPLVNSTFQVWVAAVDQLGNRFEGIIGTVEVDNAPPVLGLVTDRVAYAGVGDSAPMLRGYVTDQPYPADMQLFIGFEELGTSGPINQALDLSGNQWQAVPQPGTAAPTVVFSAPAHQADFQLGQTLVISNANRAVARTFVVDPNSASVALWINPTSVAPAEQQVLGQDDVAGFGVLLKGDQLTLRINRNGTPLDKDTGQRVVAGQWQLLILAFDHSKPNTQTITAWLNLRGSTTAGKTLTLTGSELIQKSTKPLRIGAVSNGYVGKMDDLLVYAQPLQALEARQLSNANPSAIQKVEVGFLHRQDRANAASVLWQAATLDTPQQGVSNWQIPIPGGLEGIYDISLRTTDVLNNQRVLGGVWTGVLDTLAPRIALSGTVAGTHQCVATDFSLGKNKFVCAEAQDATGTTEVDYSVEALPSAGLQWNAGWYKTFFAQSRLPARLYALQLSGRNFFTAANTAESCDIYGNCTRCIVNGADLTTPICTVYAANAVAGVAGAAKQATVQTFDESEDELLLNAEPLGPALFTMTVAYERPDAYIPGTEPAAPTVGWVIINEPYTLIDDAVLAATRPFAAAFTAASTAIIWGEALSATQYYAGWTISETAVISELTAYGSAAGHLQTLPDQGRYYAHVVAVDGDGNENGSTLGPIYFDGATPASYLNWDEDGPNQPYGLWQDAETATGQLCHLLGFEDRAALYSNGASPRSGEQLLFGTWSNEWLALHWDGVNLHENGDLHLYLDTKPGGARYAYNPYQDIAHATALVTMPERRQYQANTTDPLLADYAVIIEDGTTIQLLQWDGSGWQEVDPAQVKFRQADAETIVWLPLPLLGLTPPAIDLSLVGFVTEESSMDVWATMPGNNPLNSPQMRPEHLSAALAVDQTLLNLQTSIRLTHDANSNNTLDNCPTNVLFDESLLDIHFMADPAGETYDPVLYEGVRAAIPDDIETVLTTLCAGVSDTTNSPVCQLAQQVAANSGGGGPAVGPFGLLPATAGPQDQLTFYATVRNLSSQSTGDLVLDVVGDLPGSGSQLVVGALDPLASTVISFTATIDPNATYDFTEMSIYPIEEIDNTEEAITLTYEHAPHTVIHDIDRTAPISAELTSELFIDATGRGTIGVGEQYLTGLIFDQSAIAEITLITSPGETVTCDDTEQINAFTSTWLCAVHIPTSTPDGSPVTVALAATDAYGHPSGSIGTWEFTVDHTAPQLSLTSQSAAQSVVGVSPIGATQLATETLRLEGFAGDDRLLGGVEVCNGLPGYGACQEADLYTYTDAASATGQQAVVADAALADEAYWERHRRSGFGQG